MQELEGVMSGTVQSAPDFSGADRALLEAVLNTAVDAIVMIDSAGTILQVNASTQRLFGYSSDELVGHNISKLMPAPHRDQHDQYMRNYLKTGEKKIIGIGREVQAITKQGKLVPVDLAVSEVQIQGQRVFTGMLRDMTARKTVEDALRREQDFAAQLVDTANAVVLILDEEGQIKRFNRYFAAMTGWQCDLVAGRDWLEVFVPEEDRDRLREAQRQLLDGESIEGFVAPVLTQSGDRRTVVWSMQHLLDCDEIINGILAIGNDVTELKQAEQRLIQSERLAAIGQMVTGLAHESRNALQRSRACLDMLELDLEERPEQLKLIRRTQQALQELQRLYEEVRAYASPLRLELAPTDLAELCRETWTELTEQHARLSLTMHLNCPEHGCEGVVDRPRIRQVFRNILENAIVVSPERGEVRIHCERTEHGNAPAIRLTFQDQGPGLNAEQVKRIFDPFYTTKTRGTGLGMAIAKRIVDAHQGEIRVGHSAGGAIIHVTLPVTPPARPANP